MNAVFKPLIQTEYFNHVWLGIVYGLVLFWLGYRVFQLLLIPSKTLRSVLGLVPPPAPTVTLVGIGTNTVEFRCFTPTPKGIASLLIFVNNVLGTTILYTSSEFTLLTRSIDFSSEGGDKV